MREPIERFADGQVAATARVVTDGLASYNERSLGSRPHDMTVQTPGQRHENDALQHCHWTISLLKRWLPGTHAGAVRETHLQAYLDEFAFRHNRRKTKGVAASRPASSNGSLRERRSPCANSFATPILAVSFAPFKRRPPEARG